MNNKPKEKEEKILSPEELMTELLSVNEDLYKGNISYKDHWHKRVSLITERDKLICKAQKEGCYKSWYNNLGDSRHELNSEKSILNAPDAI